MTREDFLQNQYQASVTAGMNQRYHQSRAEEYWKLDTAAKILTGIFATTGFALSVVTAFVSSTLAAGLGISVAAGAAIGAIVMNVIPFGTWELHHRNLLQRWSDIREQADGLEFGLSDAGDPSRELVGRLKALDAKIHQTCGLEAKPDEKLLAICFEREEHSRQPSGLSSAREHQPAALG